MSEIIASEQANLGQNNAIEPNARCVQDTELAREMAYAEVSGRGVTLRFTRAAQVLIELQKDNGPYGFGVDYFMKAMASSDPHDLPPDEERVAVHLLKQNNGNIRKAFRQARKHIAEGAYIANTDAREVEKNHARAAKMQALLGRK